MRSTRKWWVLLAAACWLASRTQGVPNASFEEGTDAPAGWQLEGAGAWLDRDGDHYVTVTGTGENSGYWRTTEPVLAPDTLYRIRFSAEARGSGGVVIGGPSFCNRDSPPAPGWQERGFVFRSPGPERTEGAFLRFGQWYVRGVVGIDDVRLSPTEPVHRRTGDVVLGEGEWLDGAEYGFEAPLGGEGSNDSRPLHRFTAGFNTNRWVLGPGDEVVYRHEVPGASQLGARVEMNCTYHTRGAGVLEASWDGSEWHRLARFDGLGAVRADLPAGLLPAETVYVRIMAADEASGEPGSFQVSRYGYVARLGTEFAHVEGATLYPDVTQRDAGLKVAILSAGEGLALSVRNAPSRLRPDGPPNPRSGCRQARPRRYR
ncbi:MAG: hypothetical protein AMK73_05210 [Planctomycetes bacterium SM23_32]|nr:MAG: hypothetical protein AMK73_05210 [Planctomycetes bacterium SM23_32]